jgi:DNA-directed RNA polymerase specialized sigma24 family protein
MYSVFTDRGVADVPDPRGSLAKAFGKRAYMMLMSKFHDLQFVEDVMLNFLVRFLESGSRHLKPDMSLRDSENYVLRSLTNEALNAKRKKREVSDTYTSEGDEKRHELPIFDEDTAERQLKRMLPRIKSKLEAIHPDAPLYLKLSILDGYSDREILGDVEHGGSSLLTHPYGKQGKPLNEKVWNGVYKPQIFAVLKNNFGDAQRV